jgi:hypothetical protein
MNACGLEVFQQPPMIEVKSPLFVFVENGIGQPPIRARFIFGTLCRRKGERPNLLAGLMTQGCYGLVPTVDSFFYFLSRPPMGRRDSALLFLRHKPEAWSDHIESHREADKSKWSPSAGPGPRSSFCSPAWPSNRKTSAEAGGHMASGDGQDMGRFHNGAPYLASPLTVDMTAHLPFPTVPDAGGQSAVAGQVLAALKASDVIHRRDQGGGRVQSDPGHALQVLHPFAYSAPIRPPIPLEGGHPIRSNPASHSGAFRPPVPE